MMNGFSLIALGHYESATERAVRHAAEARAAVASDPAFGAAEVLAWMRKLCPFHEWARAFPEMATGMAEAAIDMPLALSAPVECACHPPTERDEHHMPIGVSTAKWDDIRMTAALLTALAWTESAFQPNLVSGDRFGLFLIQARGALDDATPLLLPMTAAAAALERLRAQVQAATPGEPLEQVLSWYADHEEGPLSRGELPALPTTTAIVPVDEMGFDMTDSALARSRCRLDLASWLLSEGA